MHGDPALRLAAAAAVRQTAHNRADRGMGRGPEYIPARDRRRAAGLVDPLHGGGHRALVSVPVGQPGYPLAGSRLCLRPGIYSGGTGRPAWEWQLHCALFPHRGGGDGLALAPAGRCRWRAVRDGVLAGTPPPQPDRQADSQQQGRAGSRGDGRHGFCGEQPCSFWTMAK